MATSRPPAGWSTSGAGRRKSIAALPSWRVFRLGGTEISLDASWFIFFGVSAVVAAFFELPRRWSGAFGTVPDGLADVSHWAAGLLAAALIFGSILAHELAHFVRAKQLGIAAPKIRLYVFGDVVEPMHEPVPPKQEVAIAIAGPIVSAVLGGVCLGLARVLPDDSLPQVAVQLVGEFNLFLAGFSLLPGFPLDGGRVLRGGHVGGHQRCPWGHPGGQPRRHGVEHPHRLVGVLQFRVNIRDLGVTRRLVPMVGRKLVVSGRVAPEAPQHHAGARGHTPLHSSALLPRCVRRGRVAGHPQRSGPAASLAGRRCYPAKSPPESRGATSPSCRQRRPGMRLSEVAQALTPQRCSSRT